MRAVSAAHWDQDDVNEYDGDHVVMPEGGYGELLTRIAAGIKVCPVGTGAGEVGVGA